MGDRFLFTFANERDFLRVKKVDPWCLERAMLLIKEKKNGGMTDTWSKNSVEGSQRNIINIYI